ncbi:reverse transcriptase domain-containing protein [Tanacetum coccineum]
MKFQRRWERFKGLLRQCPHHGFSELHQLDMFYNSLNTNDHYALDSAAGGNFLDKMPRDGLAIIESKSKGPSLPILKIQPPVYQAPPQQMQGVSKTDFENYVKANDAVSDPLHHEFAGELLTLPSRIVREHEDYLNRMTLLYEISISRSQENVHANPSSIIESLPVSPIPIEDSEPVQEEIDIFLVPDDLIPPGVENDDSKEEDNELPNLDHQDNPSSPRPPPEPPDVGKCLEPEAGVLITKVFKGVSKPHDFMADILLTLPTLVSDLTFILFLSLFLSFGSEDTIFDPGIITFPFSYLKQVVRIRQKSQENRQKRANTDTRTEKRARAGSQKLDVTNLSHWSLPIKERTRWIEDSTRDEIFYTLHTHNGSTNVSITDCHASNPKVQDLERNVSYDEIKSAVWDCGHNKSSGPDGFTFEFFLIYWNIIDLDVVAVVISLSLFSDLILCFQKKQSQFGCSTTQFQWTLDRARDAYKSRLNALDDTESDDLALGSSALMWLRIGWTLLHGAGFLNPSNLLRKFHSSIVIVLDSQTSSSSISSLLTPYFTLHHSPLTNQSIIPPG